MYQVMCTGQNPAEDAICQRAARVLMAKYPVKPPHLWYVEVRDGLIWLKTSMTGKACMARHLGAINFSDSNFEKEIERAAGELLERANLSRTNMDMEYAIQLDGGDAFNWKPAVRATA